MFFDPSQDKIHASEVVKWGIFAGFLEGLLLALLTIVYAKRFLILNSVGFWEYSTSLFLVSLLVLGSILTTVIMFGHPIYCLLRKHYRDAAITIVFSLFVTICMTLFAIATLPLLQGSVY